MGKACSVLLDDWVLQLAAAGDPDDCRRGTCEYTRGIDEALLMSSFGD
jgi:hypothetical protein